MNSFFGLFVLLSPYPNRIRSVSSPYPYAWTWHGPGTALIRTGYVEGHKISLKFAKWEHLYSFLFKQEANFLYDCPEWKEAYQIKKKKGE